VLRRLGERVRKEPRSQQDLIERLGAARVWEEFGERGERAVVAIFDTSFCEEFFGRGRILDTFYGPDVGSAFEAPEEGHGTMTALLAAGNTEEGAPFDGVAPEAKLLLARVTNREGHLVYIEEAEDWLVSKVRELGLRAVVVNKSYGVPLCTGRPRWNFCEDTFAQVLREVQSMREVTEVYAAGNEAMHCGHRVSGTTNAITGHNSLETNFCVGAQRWDGAIQSYSSHGFGDCDPINHPKPDIVFMIPHILAYGCEVKDFTMRDGGSGGGTSSAAPLCAGTLALMRSARPELDDPELRRILYETAELPRTTQVSWALGYDARFGHGSVDIYRTLERALR